MQPGTAETRTPADDYSGIVAIPILAPIYVKGRVRDRYYQRHTATASKIQEMMNAVPPKGAAARNPGAWISVLT